MKKLISVCLAAVLTLAVLLLPAPLDACAASFQVDFELNSKSVYLKNLDTDSVVFTKEPELRCFPASTTKIMTYIITAEHVMDLKNTRVTVKGEVLSLLNGTGSSIAGLLDGEELSVYQLLNCMMIPSGNDAALILADFVGGGSCKPVATLVFRMIGMPLDPAEVHPVGGDRIKKAHPQILVFYRCFGGCDPSVLFPVGDPVL